LLTGWLYPLASAMPFLGLVSGSRRVIQRELNAVHTCKIAACRGYRVNDGSGLVTSLTFGIDDVADFIAGDDLLLFDVVVGGGLLDIII